MLFLNYFILSSLTTCLLANQLEDFNSTAKINAKTMEREWSKKVRLQNQGIRAANREIKKRYFLSSCGMGMNTDRSYISVDFECKKPLTVNESRAIILDCLEIFIKNLNAHLDSDKPTRTSKYEPRNIGISIFLSNKDYDPFKEPYPCVASKGSQDLEYYFKSEEQEFGYKEIIEETLEEAEAKNREYLKSLVDDSASKPIPTRATPQTDSSPPSKKQTAPSLPTPITP